MNLDLLWVSEPSNRKTGAVPTAYVGTTRIETWESCEGCPLRATTCYAWKGTPTMGLASVQRTNAIDPDRYTIESALANRRSSARMVRFGAIGDPARASKRAIRKAAALARKAGLAVVGYTHHWREKRNASLRSTFMASADDLRGADAAISAGWIPATVVSETTTSHPATPRGRKLLLCPAITSKGKTTCNDCRLCDPSNSYWQKQTTYRGIAFPDHGPVARARAKKEASK